MERLTYRAKGGLICLNNDFKLSNPLVIAMEKLAEFEDFMEEYGFEDLEHLKLRLENLQHIAKYYARWEKLKDCIDTFQEHNIDEANLAWKILDKIQELKLAD